jgi:hypothetical protein
MRRMDGSEVGESLEAGKRTAIPSYMAGGPPRPCHIPQVGVDAIWPLASIGVCISHSSL